MFNVLKKTTHHTSIKDVTNHRGRVWKLINPLPRKHEKTPNLRTTYRRGNTNFQTGLKESYKKLGGQGNHTNRLLMTKLYTKLLKIRNSRLTS